MHHDQNYSSAYDVSVLARHALTRNPDLVEIVNTKNYCCASKTMPGHIYNWENTNYMLWDKSKQYYGVKTGVTPTAGPCLSVHFKSKCGNFDFQVTILNCKTREARYSEIPKLVEWAQSKINRVRRMNYKPSLKKQLLRNITHF